MDTLLRDVRYATRGLLRTRGFSAVVVLTLELGARGAARVEPIVVLRQE